MKTFQPKLFTCFKNYGKGQLVNDIVAGVIVAIIALPLSIALAIASGVSPEQGLYTAVIAGFFIAFFGGSRVNISGPTAAFATIVAGVVASQGISGLVLATLLAGVILILLGVFRLGSLIKYIPMTITTGFTAGIAVTIAVGQIKDFLGLTFAPGTVAIETAEKVEAIVHSIGTFNWQALLVGGIAMAILIAWPMLGKKIKGKAGTVFSKVPPSIIAVIVGILLVQFTPLQVSTIGTLYPDLSAGFPTPSVPSFSLETLTAVLPDAFTIAVLAAIESLLSCVVSDGMIGDRHNSNTELIAQGIGNVCSSLFGGIPATGAIARTAANVKNGGRSPVSGIVHAVVLLLFLLVLMPVAKMIPMPVIAAILLMVAYNMSEWRHFVHICKKSPKSDILVLVLTFVLTVVFDLVVAIAVGLVLAVILFMKRMSDVTHIRRWEAEHDSDDPGALPIPADTVVYEVHGPLFFADTDLIREFTVADTTKTIIIRMGDVATVDASAMKVLEDFAAECKKNNTRLVLSHVNAHPMKVMKKAGFFDSLGAENFSATIEEALELAEKKN